jgi:hypothetical protein
MIEVGERKCPWFVLRCSHSVWEQSLRKITSPNNICSSGMGLQIVGMYLFICGLLNEAVGISD